MDPFQRFAHTVSLHLINRAKRELREAQIAIGPGWIDADPPDWRFPTFAVRSRPFDHEWD
jgi:hypothetical protein